MFSTQQVSTGSPMIDALESRTLLHGGRHGGLQIPDPPSAQVQADLDAVKAATAQLRTDQAALAKTLRADARAIKAAIRALQPTLQPLYDTLKADSKTWATTLRADRNAIRAARKAGDDAALQAAKDLYTQHQADAKAALKADADAIKAAIDADPAVQTARAQYDKDFAPIQADLDVLKTAKQKLKDDIANGL